MAFYTVIGMGQFWQFIGPASGPQWRRGYGYRQA